MTRTTMSLNTAGCLAALLALGACDTPAAPPDTSEPPSVALTLAAQPAEVGRDLVMDLTQGGRTFTNPSGRGLTYNVAFGGPSRGLRASGSSVTGVPAEPGVVRGTVAVTDAAGRTAKTTFAIAVFSQGLPQPALPATRLRYAVTLPAHFASPGPGGSVASTDNTPASNPVTDAGATLGRVLFYDRRLSVNDGISCASCHRQEAGFSDPRRLSVGFNGGSTPRHSIGLTNARFYNSGRFFWDERAATLEEQVLHPIQDPVEMGMLLTDLVTKVEATSFYPPLFEAAFGSAEVTSQRIARALAQFTRSMVSAGSPFDSAFAGGPQPGLSRLTPQQAEGFRLFTGPEGGCGRCHGTVAQLGAAAFNTGLDATITDAGAGNGRFKTPSLRNVAVRAPFMHDGRFVALEQVVEHYNSGVQNNPGLDPGLRGPNGQPRRLNLSSAQKAALVAFLHALTDRQFLADPRFGDPFGR
jgi:cytochrome c peroxidase